MRKDVNEIKRAAEKSSNGAYAAVLSSSFLHVYNSLHGNALKSNNNNNSINNNNNNDNN